MATLEFSIFASSLMRAVLAFSLLFAASGVHASPDRVANFSLLDHEGNAHQLSKYGDSKAVVLISIASQCQANLQNLHKYRLLQTSWESEGVSFLAIAASASDQRDDLKRFDELYRIDMPILNDRAQLVAESLGISRAGEILVVDPDRLRVLYRGGLDIEPRRARPEQGIEARAGTDLLAVTLQQAVNGDTSKIGATVLAAAEGCELSFP
ncbi:MAG: redoxin domain-containing protein, partial [Proteobacteria bacterium]|nr:redoxin domain-containing protein [Pseudomonadota bacterium]